MKQSEIDRELRLVAKAEAKRRGWKSVDGSPYWTIGPLFFDLLLVADAKGGSLTSRLSFKWLDLDRVLRKVLGLPDEEVRPFSLHANGVFVLSGWELNENSVRGLDWLPGVLARQVEGEAQQAYERASDVASRISSIDSYLEFIQREHETFMKRHPRAAVNIWKETLLVAMTLGELKKAAEIARTRIAAGDPGTFISEGGSFYERALALCDT